MKIKSISLAELFYTIDTYGTFSTELLHEEWFDESEFNHSMFLKELADLHAEIIGNCLPAGGIKSVDVVSVGSPREYNFSTDWCELEIEVDLPELLGYIKPKYENHDIVQDYGAELDKFLHDRFTSRDGFWSFTPNNLRDFLKAIDGQNDGLCSEEDREKCVTILAGWYLTREVLTEDEYLDQMYDRVHEIMDNNFEQFTPETWGEYAKYGDEFRRQKETQSEFKGFPPGQMYPMEIEDWYKEMKGDEDVS